jgi:hypothetical protein
MKLKNNPTIIESMRKLVLKGKKSVEILYFLDRKKLRGIEMMSHFREAFDLDFDDVSCIGGWFPDGSGELSDKAINALLDSAIAKKCFKDKRNSSGMLSLF